MGPGAFAQQLIVEFCLPAITKSERGKSPVEGARLSEDARLKLGLDPGGQTVRYPLDGAPVYLDMNGAEQQVFFTHADARTIGDGVNAALKQAFPDLRLLNTLRATPHRRRIFQCSVGGSNVAIIELIEPAPRSPAKIIDFAARITALAKTDAPSQTRN